MFVNIPLDYVDVSGQLSSLGHVKMFFKFFYPFLFVRVAKKKFSAHSNPFELNLNLSYATQTEAPSPSECSIDSTSGMGGVGGIGSVGSNSSVGLASGSSGQVGVAAGVCAACGELITDRFLIQVSGRTWHSTCLRCSVCRTALDNQPSCFVRAGAIYCRADYTR